MYSELYANEAVASCRFKNPKTGMSRIGILKGMCAPLTAHYCMEDLDLHLQRENMYFIIMCDSG